MKKTEKGYTNVRNYDTYASFNVDTERNDATISFVEQDNSILVRGKRYSQNAECYVGSDVSGISTTGNWFLCGETTMAVGTDVHIIASLQQTLEAISKVGLFAINLRYDGGTTNTYHSIQWLTKVGSSLPKLRLVVNGASVKLYCQVYGGQYRYAHIRFYNQVARVPNETKNIFFTLADSTTIIPDADVPSGTDIADVPYLLKSETAAGSQKVLQTYHTGNYERKVLLGENNNTTQQDAVYKSSGLTYNPNSKTLTVPQVNGNAATATKATRDGNGIVIAGNYQRVYKSTFKVTTEGWYKLAYKGNYGDGIAWKDRYIVVNVQSSQGGNTSASFKVFYNSQGGWNINNNNDFMCIPLTATNYACVTDVRLLSNTSAVSGNTYIEVYLRLAGTTTELSVNIESNISNTYLYNTATAGETDTSAYTVITRNAQTVSFGGSSAVGGLVAEKALSANKVKQIPTTINNNRRVLLGGDNDNEEYESTYKSKLLTYNPAKGEFEITDTASSFILAPTSPWFQVPTALWDRGFWLKYGDTSLGRLIGAKGEVSDIEYYYIGGTFTNPDFKFNPATKTMEGNVLGNLQTHGGNEVFIGNQGGAGESTNDTVWINYRDAVGSQTTNDSTQLAHYYFGNRKGGHSGVYLHAARFKGIADAADKLQTARKIGFANFDGTANVSLNAIQGANVTRWTSSGTLKPNQWIRIMRMKFSQTWSNVSITLAIEETEQHKFRGIINFTAWVGSNLTPSVYNSTAIWYSLYQADKNSFGDVTQYIRMIPVAPTNNDANGYVDVYVMSPLSAIQYGWHIINDRQINNASFTLYADTTAIIDNENFPTTYKSSGFQGVLATGETEEYNTWVTKATTADLAAVANKTKYPIIFKRNGASITNWFADTTFVIDIPEELLDYSAPTGITLKVPEISVANKVANKLSLTVNGSTTEYDGSAGARVSIKANCTHIVKANSSNSLGTLYPEQTGHPSAVTVPISILPLEPYNSAAAGLNNGDTLILHVPNTMSIPTSNYVWCVKLDITKENTTDNIIPLIHGQSAGTPAFWNTSTTITAGFYQFVYSATLGGLVYMYRNTATS